MTPEHPFHHDIEAMAERAADVAPGIHGDVLVVAVAVVGRVRRGVDEIAVDELVPLKKVKREVEAAASEAEEGGGEEVAAGFGSLP